MNHYVYEITNLINDKKYIGKRSCHCPIEEDNYMGSGIVLKKAQKKYGIKNFKKKILEVCNSEDQAFKREEYLGNYYNVVRNNMYYNLAECGGGGMKPFASMSELEYKEMNRIKGLKLKNSGNMRGKSYLCGISYFDVFSQEQYESMKIKISQSLKGRFAGENNPMYGVSRKGKDNPMYGTTHSDEWKIEHGIKMTGENNPMYGKFGKEHPASKRVKCINNGYTFNSVREASKWCGLKSGSTISACCLNKRKSSGKHPVTKENLQWEFI